LEYSGLGNYVDKVHSGIHNLTYNLFRGSPLIWKATVVGTIVSGYGFTYLANSCLVHAYLKTTLGLPCFVHTPEAVDKDSGDDQFVKLTDNMYRRFIRNYKRYYITDQKYPQTKFHGLG